MAKEEIEKQALLWCVIYKERQVISPHFFGIFPGADLGNWQKLYN